MGPHPPSSPIASEHATDDLEIKLKHGLQSASQVASTSRKTIDSPDASRSIVSTAENTSNSVHQSSAPHTQFPDWQEQRRCHSILADYDYASPAEDRRDPRSSNACSLVLPVSKQQPQVVVASAPHDIHCSDTSMPAPLQQPSIAIRRDASVAADHSATLANDSIGAVEDTVQIADLHSASLQTAVTQPSSSMSPSPEGGRSPSPCFTPFGYHAQRSHVSHPFSSSVPGSARPRPDATDGAANHTLESPPCLNSRSAAKSVVCPSDELEATRHLASRVAHDAIYSSSATSHNWLRTTSLPLHELHQRKPQVPSEVGEDVTTHASSVSPKGFQLQPVPPAKRRKVEDTLESCAEDNRRSVDGADDARRPRDVGSPSDNTQRQPRSGTAEPAKSIEGHHAMSGVPSQLSTRYATGQAKVAVFAGKDAMRALGPSHRTNIVSPSGQADGVSKRAAHADISPSPASKAPLRKQHASSFRRMPRLIRAQSVPNLRAKATLDIAAPSHHRLLLPAHWASYVSSHTRPGREGSSTIAKSSTSRCSKILPFHFNSAHDLPASNSSRSRSTFTPTLHPPITRHTLRELDLFEILKNPQLRHDVVFDPNVQFRPNFDGERGRRKREAGERYWTAVVREIELGCTCTSFSHGQLLPCTCKTRGRSGRSCVTIKQEAATDRNRSSGHFAGLADLPQSRIPSRIPLLVQELRTICLSILPSNYPADSLPIESYEATPEERKASDSAASSSDTKPSACSPSTPAWATTHHQLLARTLDPHLIAQELQHGVLDVPALITFMGSILKLHCAPMRDEAIEKMVEVVCVDRNIGKGLRLCFEILELMKLDIANHQLRSARPFLVETAVDFEIRWFKEQIEQGKMSLDKTTAWIQQAFTSQTSSSGRSRSEKVIDSFNCGMLDLIFNVPGSLPVLSPVATPLSSPSSSSLNNTFASHYPETFQFDAYRMMTFHNDVSDLTIVYMLVLLFRQLCSTPLDDGRAVPASVGNIVQRQLKSMKGEIWCLVNDANLCLSSSSTSPCTPTTASGITSPGRRSAGADGKMFLGSAGGIAKLDHPRWRRAMQSVLLQVAARASAVQAAAHLGSTDPKSVKAAAPSVATQKLLSSWMDTNLRSGSALHKICQDRLRGVVLSLLTDKVRNGLQASSSGALTAPTFAVTSADIGPANPSKQKRASPLELHEDKAVGSNPAKRLKSNITSADSKSLSTSTAVAAASTNTSSDAAMSRAGLEPFAAEIRLLSDRIAKVATFHLRVFRNLYEGIESCRHQASAAQRA